MTLPFDQTLGLSHPFSVGKNVHSILGNPNASGLFYADIAARDADTDFQVLENVGKAVAVTSPLSIFVLMFVGPAVWLELSSTLTDSFLELIDTPSSYSGQAFKVPRVNAGETGLEFFADAGGDVVGPSSSTDNALARFDLATGKLIQNSLGILDDVGVLSGLTQLNLDNLRLDGNTLSTTDIDGNLLLAPNGNGVVDVTTRRIINVFDPFSDQDAATKKYVDDQIVLFDTFLELIDVFETTYTGQGLNLVRVNAAETGLEFGGAAGDVIGPSSATDNALVRFDLATGKLIQNSVAILNDIGILSGILQLTAGNLNMAGNTIQATDVNGQLILRANGFGSAVLQNVGFFDNRIQPFIANADLIIESNGNSTITIQTAGSGDIELAANGTGGIVLSGAPLNVSTQKIINLVDPTADQDGATKKYVDDQILTQDTFLELTDTPSSYSSQANRVVGVNPGETGLDFKSLIVLPDGQVTINGTTDVPLRVLMDAATGNPSLIDIGDTVIRGRVGFFGTGGLTDGAFFGQIGWSNNGALQMTSRGNFAGGGIQMFTPNAALDTQILRMTIADLTGQVLIESTLDTVLRLKMDGGNASLISHESAIPRSLSGFFGFNPLPLDILETQVGGRVNGQVILATRGNFAGGGIRCLTFGGVTGVGVGLVEAMKIQDGTGGNAGSMELFGGIITHKTNVADANYTIISSDNRIAITSISAARTITIPTAEIAKGSPTQVREWAFKDESGNVNGTDTVEILTEGAETIDGAPSLLLTIPFFDFKLYANGSDVFLEAA